MSPAHDSRDQQFLDSDFTHRVSDDAARPVLNTHFVLPIWTHPFVELMRGELTSDATMEVVRSFMSSIGVLPVIVQKESTGFIFNRIWRAVKKEALKVVDQGIATVEDVDRNWMTQMETPLGPFAPMDNIGLDVVRDIELIYYRRIHDSRFARQLANQLEIDQCKNSQHNRWQVNNTRGRTTKPFFSWKHNSNHSGGGHWPPVEIVSFGVPGVRHVPGRLRASTVWLWLRARFSFVLNAMGASRR